jgi:PAS domain S-box-containing protein
MHGKAALRKRDAPPAFADSVLAAAMESSPDGILIVSEQGQVISYNDKFFDMRQLPRELADAPSYNALLDAALQKLKHPDAFSARVMYLYDHPEEPSHDLIEFKDGRIFERHSRGMHAPGRGYIGRISFFRDITHRERATETLRASNAMLTTVERLASIGGWALDVGGDQLDWSEELYIIFGREPQDFPATVANFISIIHPDDSERVRHSLAATLEQNAPYDLEFRIIRPDKTERVIHTRGESTLDQAGKVIRLTETAHDITERKNTERSAQNELRRMQTQSDIVGQVGQFEALLSGDVETLAHEVTELASRATGCERVNVWLFNDEETELRCIDLFEATSARHSSGMTLSEKEFGAEIAIIKASRYVNADDPMNDPRTAGYVEPYIKPLRITSMLDVAIQSSGRSFGLLCFEHVDQPHHWTQDEIAFARQLADKIGISS